MVKTFVWLILESEPKVSSQTCPDGGRAKQAIQPRWRWPSEQGLLNILLKIQILPRFPTCSSLQAITDIVRGSLCPAIQRLLEEGLRRYNPLAGPPHPWYKSQKPTLIFSFQGTLWWKLLGRRLPTITTLSSPDSSFAKHFALKRTERCVLLTKVSRPIWSLYISKMLLQVLSPEELLYRCVHLVQQTHDR